jgi:two-component system chemotaxis response regulator CheY
MLKALPLHVLLVDDSWYMHHLVREILECHGWGIQRAESVEEAISLYRQQRPDVVLMDLVLPHRDGLDGIRALRAMDPGARIIVVSGLLDESTRRQAEDEGISGFVSKPFTSADLLTAIRSAVAEPSVVAWRLQVAG